MAALVVMGAILAGCSKSEIEVTKEDTPEVVEPVAEDNIVVCTTTVSFETDATKALNEDGVKTFAAGDMIAVIYKNTSNQTVKAVSNPLPDGDYGNSASFTVSLTNPAGDAAVRIIYPAAMAATTIATNVDVDADATINYAALNTQNGTLETLSSNLDLAVYDGNLEGTSLPADPALHNKLAICIYTLKDNAATPIDITSTITGMTISDGTYNYTVNRSAAAGPIYVAIRPTSDATINYTATNGTNYYKKTVTDKTYAASQMYPLGLRMATSSIIDLATLPADFTAQHNNLLTGSLGDNYKISIADGATVTLDGVTINGENDDKYAWAGLTCLGDATIILKDGTTNTVKGFYEDYPGIQSAKRVGEGEEYTLTVSGTGALTASSNGCGAGIGGGWNIACGNITISGGTVTATGGEKAAGIGSSFLVSCGNIRITGGTVNAIGGNYASGIGSAYYGSCNNITITSDVTSVTATKGSGAPNSIGAGYYCTCGTVTILGTVYWNGSAYQNGGDIFLPTSPLYAHVPFGAVPGKFSVNYSRKVYISNGNLQYNKSADTWSFMSPQYNTVETSDQNVGDNYSNQNIVSLFGWGTSGYDDKYPYATSTSDGSYAAVDLAGTNYDWGVYNTITNGNTGWRTLTDSEWDHLLKTRSYTSYSYAMGTIHSTNGMIIFPDEFNPTAVGVTITSPNSGSSGYVSYSDADWTKMEAAGCVFLPAAGRRPRNSPTTVADVGTNGYYWTTTIMSNWAAHWRYFSTSGPDLSNGYRSYGMSVRLVKDAE